MSPGVPPNICALMRLVPGRGFGAGMNSPSVGCNNCMEFGKRKFNRKILVLGLAS